MTSVMDIVNLKKKHSRWRVDPGKEHAQTWSEHESRPARGKQVTL